MKALPLARPKPCSKMIESVSSGGNPRRCRMSVSMLKFLMAVDGKHVSTAVKVRIYVEGCLSCELDSCRKVRKLVLLPQRKEPGNPWQRPQHVMQAKLALELQMHLSLCQERQASHKLSYPLTLECLIFSTGLGPNTCMKWRQ